MTIPSSLTTDIEWCFANAKTLTLERFAIQFGYLNKHRANSRYKDILDSRKFQDYEDTDKLRSQFKTWRGSTLESAFWNEVALKEKKKHVEARLETDGYDTAKHFSLKASINLRSTEEPEPLLPNKHFKASHDDNTKEQKAESPTSELLSGDQSENDWENIMEDPRSDLSIDHNPFKNGSYYVVADSNRGYETDSDANSVESTSWIVEDVDVGYECLQYREDCLVKHNPKQLDDNGLLALNHIYFFAEPLASSITRHFDCAEAHRAIINTLGINTGLPSIDHKSYEWCAQCGAATEARWMELQAITINILNEALQRNSELEMIVANILFRIVPLFKITGYEAQRGEDSFVHNVLSPLLDVIFSVNANLNHFWANVQLNDLYKEYKPDYGVYTNGLSRRFVILIGEFKPKEARQRNEGDFVKLAKQMRILLNELLDIGVEEPVVAGILVKDNKLSTYKMHLEGAKLYILTRLACIQLMESSDDLVALPTIVRRLAQLKDLSVSTAKKVHTQAKKIRKGKAIVNCSVPPSWLSKTFYSTVKRETEAKPTTL